MQQDVDEGIVGWWRRTFLTAAGSDKERRLLEHYGIGDNQIQVTGNAGNFVACISWPSTEQATRQEPQP